MSDLILKYNLLDKESKKEVSDFLDFLLSKRASNKTGLSEYKQNILKVSGWSEGHVRSISDAQKGINEWRPAEW